MTDQELHTVVSGILRSRVPDAGFQGVEVKSGLDSGGEPVIHVVAHYRRRPNVKPDPLLAVGPVLQSELFARGEDRFILLKNEVDEEQDVGEDID